MSNELPEVEDSKAENSINLRALRRFSQFLVSALNSVPSQKEILYKKVLGVDKKDRESLKFNVPLYQLSQACYAVNKFLKKRTRIIQIASFNEGNFYPPTYDNIEVRRGERIALLVDGSVFFSWKETNFVANLYYESRSAYTNFYFKKSDKKVAFELVEAVRNYMQSNNFLKGEKLKVVNGVLFRFLEYPKLSWSDIILSKEIEDEIRFNLIFPLTNEKLCKQYKIPWRRGILLGGEPGTGKTRLAKVLCNLLKKTTVIWVTAESISEPWHVKKLFEAARYFSPSLIVMEDIDFFGKDRAIERCPIVGELLNQLDGYAPNEGVFVMATSNRPGLLDKALASRPGRFDVKLEIKLPDLECRHKLIELFTRDIPISSMLNLNSIARRTESFTGAHIREIFIYALLDSVRKGYKEIREESLLKAIKRLRKKSPSSIIA